MFPALSDASRDPALKGHALTVYVWLTCNLLDWEEYRPLKVEGLSRAIGVSRPTASKALRILVRRGYLARRYVASRGYEYRYFTKRREAA